MHVSTRGPAGPWKAANGTAQGYPFDDCPAVHVLPNGSLATWSQPLYPDGCDDPPCTKPIFVAQRWGEPFVAVQPTVSFPRFLVERAREGGSVIKLDDPTMWVDRRGNWHVLAHA